MNCSMVPIVPKYFSDALESYQNIYQCQLGFYKFYFDFYLKPYVNFYQGIIDDYENTQHRNSDN